MSCTPTPRDGRSSLPAHRAPHRDFPRPRCWSWADVRRWTEAALPLAEDLVDDALLVVNELVANAYDHTRTPVRLHLLADDGRIHVEVEDGSRVLPAPRGPHPAGPAAGD